MFLIGHLGKLQNILRNSELILLSFVSSFLFIQDDEVIRRILTHCGLWKDPPERPPPRLTPALPAPYPGPDVDVMPDYSLSDDTYDEE
jgi:hypothetical protein